MISIHIKETSLGLTNSMIGYIALEFSHNLGKIGSEKLDIPAI
ncbi:hypothetical protein SHPE106448_11500 [Shewanella pealeana]